MKNLSGWSLCFSRRDINAWLLGSDQQFQQKLSTESHWRLVAQKGNNGKTRAGKAIRKCKKGRV
jgi:hypothetical protein